MFLTLKRIPWTTSWTSSSVKMPSFSGKLNSPFQTPFSVRFRSNHRSPDQISKKVLACWLRLSFFFGSGISFCNPAFSAKQFSLNGQSKHCGFRVHNVAPKSINPWVYISGSFSGNRLSAIDHNCLTVSLSSGEDFRQNNRISTRLTFPSRMVSFAPKLKATIAAAVLRPTPGSVNHASRV